MSADAQAEQIRLLDLGAGTGGSLRSAMRRFGVAGIGLELNPRKVAVAQEAGLPVELADIRDIEPGAFPDVDYVTLDNVLEHLPSLHEVEEVLAKACTLANRLVHVRHPSFEDEEYLAGLGLKQYWTDWPRGHTAHVKMHEFVAMASRIGVYHTVIRPVLRAHDSTDGTILPASAPTNQTKLRDDTLDAYDPARHDPKPEVVFDRPVYYAFDLFLVVGHGEPVIDYPGDTETSDARPRVDWLPHLSAAERESLERHEQRAAAASRWLDALGDAESGEGEAGDAQAGEADPFIVRRADGTKFLIEEGRRRQIGAAVTANALQRVLGGPKDVDDADVASWPEGPPVEVLQGPSGPPFVVVAGRRRALRGLPQPFPVDEASVDRFPEGDPLDAGATPVRTTT